MPKPNLAWLQLVFPQIYQDDIGVFSRQAFDEAGFRND